MDIICDKCARDPRYHSLKKISEKGNVITYYANQSKAIAYTDTEWILLHCENALKDIGKNNWICIINSENFSIKHALEIKTGIGIAKLVMSKYADNLIEIRIVNPTWHIKTMLTVIWPFLNQRTCDKIIILDDRYYSDIEFL
jgi:hypothetical protein